MYVEDELYAISCLRAKDVFRTAFAPCRRILRPVSGFAYEIRLLRVSNLLCTYMACALKATCSYKYNFARKATYCVGIRLVRSRRLVCTSTSSRVSDLCVRGTTFAIKVTCAYEFVFVRKPLMRMRYNFCA